MKEGEDGAPSSFVTPKRRKKRGGTDFSNRKARQRREARRKKGVVNTITGTPVKGRGGIFCSSSLNVRKLVLDSVVEIQEESEQQTKVQRDQEQTGTIVSTFMKMTGARRGRRKQIIMSPQPSITARNSESEEVESESSKECNSDSVIILSQFTQFLHYFF